MKVRIPILVEEEIELIRIAAPVRYDEEEIPNDFPGRSGDFWQADIEIDTGKIRNWPAGRAEEMHLTVKDAGSYKLVNVSGDEVAVIEENYVPHGIVPGSYGDTIELDISADGIVTNWPRRPDFSDFFGDNT